MCDQFPARSGEDFEQMPFGGSEVDVSGGGRDTFGGEVKSERVGAEDGFVAAWGCALSDDPLYVHPGTHLARGKAGLIGGLR